MARTLPFRAVILMAAVLVPSLATAIHHEEKQHGATRAPRIVGREEAGNSFRKPGTLLSQACHEHREVDTQELRRRHIDQVCQRVCHTDSLGASTAASSEGDVEPAHAESPARRSASAGMNTWEILAFVAATLVVLAAVLYFTTRRR